MSEQKRVTIEKNIKQDVDSKQFYVAFYYGKDKNTFQALNRIKPNGNRHIFVYGKHMG